MLEEEGLDVSAGGDGFEVGAADFFDEGAVVCAVGGPEQGGVGGHGGRFLGEFGEAALDFAGDFFGGEGGAGLGDLFAQAFHVAVVGDGAEFYDSAAVEAVFAEELDVVFAVEGAFKAGSLFAADVAFLGMIAPGGEVLGVGEVGICVLEGAHGFLGRSIEY